MIKYGNFIYDPVWHLKFKTLIKNGSDIPTVLPFEHNIFKFQNFILINHYTFKKNNYMYF